MVAEYKVQLEAFEGPLDLLLFLIRRAEVDIHDIPVARITEQYLAHLEQLTGTDDSRGRIDIERAGEFLVMAATLMEIKSRMLAPPSADDPRGHDGESRDKAEADKPAVDPRAELVRQLLEYKRFRDATERLEEGRADWSRRFPLGSAAWPDRPPVAEEDNQPVELEDIDLVDLVEAFARIIETVDLARVGEHRVVLDETPVEIHAEDILDRLRRRAAESLAAEIAGSGSSDVEFAEIFAGRNRSEMIGLFLAMLELVRQRRIAVRQETTTGTIFLGLGEPDETRTESGPSEQLAQEQPGNGPSLTST